MPPPTDNVTPLPANAERLAMRARRAMETYAMSRNHALDAVIEYGQVLLEGKALFGDDRNAFGRWIVDNRLDQGSPWNNFRERAEAMRIADIGNTPDISFDGCPNSRPGDIMKWYRAKLNPPAAKPAKPRAERTIEREDKIRTLRDAGKTAKEISAVIGLGLRAVNQAMEHLAIADEAAASADAALEHFPPAHRLRIDDAIRIHKNRLDKAFERRVAVAVREGIMRADKAVRDQLTQAHVELFNLKRLQGSRGVFSKDEYNIIQKCLHPDTQPSKEQKAEAFRLLHENKARLLKQP